MLRFNAVRCSCMHSSSARHCKFAHNHRLISAVEPVAGRLVRIRALLALLLSHWAASVLSARAVHTLDPDRSAADALDRQRGVAVWKLLARRDDSAHDAWR